MTIILTWLLWFSGLSSSNKNMSSLIFIEQKQTTDICAKYYFIYDQYTSRFSIIFTISIVLQNCMSILHDDISYQNINARKMSSTTILTMAIEVLDKLSLWWDQLTFYWQGCDNNFAIIVETIGQVYILCLCVGKYTHANLWPMIMKQRGEDTRTIKQFKAAFNW